MFVSLSFSVSSCADDEDRSTSAPSFFSPAEEKQLDLHRFSFRHVRLWNIPDKRVVYWTLIPAQASSLITAAQANLITAVHFCDEGRKVTVGTFDGRFLLYNDLLQYDVSGKIAGEMPSGRSIAFSDSDEYRR